MHMRSSLVALAVAALAPHGIALAQPVTPQRLSLEAYLDLEEVGEARLSPDGRRIVYVREWFNPMSDARKSALWIMSADGSRNRYLTDGSSPRWSPAGDRLAFLACGTPGGDPDALAECGPGTHQQIYVRLMDGSGEGSVTQVSRLTESASNLAWSPDGRVIAFNQFVERPDTWTVSPPGKPAGATWTAEPRIIDQIDYRQDRRGFDRPGSTHLFTVPADGGTPRRLTDGDFDHGAPVWSPDGSTIYFDGFRAPDRDYTWYAGSYLGRPSRIYAVDVATKNIQQLTDHLGVAETPVVSPDGRRVAYLASDSTHLTYVNRRLHLMNADGSNPHVITSDFDRRIASPIWAPDGSGLYFTVEDHGTRNLYFATTGGRVRPVTEGNHTLVVTDLARNGTAVGALSSPHLPSDVVRLAVDDPRLERLTRVNDDILADVQLGDVEDFWYESVDGLRIQGWIVKPPDFDATKKYPLILSIHGGPHGMYHFGFNYSFQQFAAEDYVVLYTNPRGSSSYGSEFGNGIEDDYPGKDFDDLMRGVDEVVRRGYVDENNLFVTGCSGGGILTSWVVGHTDRFAAAAARCLISDWLSFVGTTDGTSWYRNFANLPWDDPSEHLRRSPLMYVNDITTPTLVMVGEYDLRTPVAQSEEFYAALKMQRVPTKMILFNEEWHGTTRKPSNFMRTQLYLMKWFEEYMTEDMKDRRVVAAR